MRTRIGIFALMMITWSGSEARSGGWPRYSARTGGFLQPKAGANPAGCPGSCDDIWCPVYSYFSYNPGARRQETLREYMDWYKGREPGTNPDVFAIPPLPYGPGRTRVGDSHAMTTPAPMASPAAAAAPAPGPAPAAAANAPAATPPAPGAAPAPPPIP